jgi:hypothetical protein
MDYPWWRKHYAEARDTFSGRLLTVATFGKRTERLMGDYGRNSGVGALLVAAGWGAERIIMLGYDCEYAPDGRRHWHGDHPAGLGNCVSIGKFPAQFAQAAPQLADVNIINASRHSILTLWPRMQLEQALGNPSVRTKKRQGVRAAARAMAGVAGTGAGLHHPG